MPKSKSARKPTVGPTKSRVGILQTPAPFVNIINRAQETAQLHVGVVEALNRIIEHKGNFKDWLNIIIRLYAGSIATNDFFNHDNAIVQAFNQATLAMQIVKMRPHCGWDFGITTAELNSVTLALDLTAEMCRKMTRSEIAHCYQLTSGILALYEENNRKCYPADAEDDMVATLEQEMREVAVNETELVLAAA